MGGLTGLLTGANALGFDAAAARQSVPMPLQGKLPFRFLFREFPWWQVQCCAAIPHLRVAAKEAQSRIAYETLATHAESLNNW